MKNLKLLISSLTAAVTILISPIFYGAAETYGGKLQYITSGDDIIITGAVNNPEVLDIPSKINGKEVIEIRENAFFKCRTLESINIPETVERLGHHAFYGCTALKSATIESELSKIENGCFYGCSSLKSLDLPDSVTEIEDYSLFGCSKLERIKLPKNIVNIGQYSFSGCGALESIIIPDGTLNIEDYAFFRCDRLGNAIIPDTVMSMGKFSFGFTGGPKLSAVQSFTITGSEKSNAKIYADKNSLCFSNIENTPKPHREINFSRIIKYAMIALSVIFSALFLKLGIDSMTISKRVRNY